MQKKKRRSEIIIIFHSEEVEKTLIFKQLSATAKTH